MQHLTTDFMKDSTWECIALRHLNILKLLSFKSITTINHSKCKFKYYANKCYEEKRTESPLDQKLKRYKVFSDELHLIEVICTYYQECI